MGEDDCSSRFIIPTVIPAQSAADESRAFRRSVAGWQSVVVRPWY